MNHMKCVCGYERESGFDEAGKWQDYLQGSADFIRLKVTVTVDTDDRDNAPVVLYACPKCRTVQMVEE